MSAQAFETTLARLYTDPAFRELFLAFPERALEGGLLTAEEMADLQAVDRTGLVMAAHSYYRKRNGTKRKAWSIRKWIASRMPT